MGRRLTRLLVVEDNAHLLRTLKTALGDRYSELRLCATIAEARCLLLAWTPDLMLVDFALPDGTAFELLDLAAACDPVPLVIAMSGEAGADQSFELAQRGVREYLKKPVTIAGLQRAIERAASTAPELGAYVRQTVGHEPLHGVEARVRRTMVREALSRSRGSRSMAARLLGISRQLLQHILRRTDG